jgi:hypothetical protein
MTTAAERLETAIQSSGKFGWELIQTHPYLKMRRMTDQETPEYLPERLWPDKTYTQVEIVSIVAAGGRVVSCHFEHGRNPWTESRTQKVSIKKAIEILTTPKEES